MAQVENEQQAGRGREQTNEESGPGDREGQV